MDVTAKESLMPEPLLGDDYMTMEQVTSELGKSTRTLIRWHSRRMGPPRIRLGKSILYKRSAVREWLDSRGEKEMRGERK